MSTKIKDAVYRWYEGEYIPHENRPGAAIAFVGGWYRRHWTALAARAVLEFCAREWKWLLGFLLAFLTAMVAMLQ